MAKRRRQPGGTGRTKRLRKKLIKWLWSQQEPLPNGRYLYHGTSDVYRLPILKNGLRPRNNRPSIWADQPSHSQMVYLTDSYPHVFGTQGGNRITVAFEIDAMQLDPRRLLPDEDYLVQKGLVGPDGHETAHSLARRRIREFRELWRGSLRELGTCCYEGRIRPSSFVRATLLDRADNFPLANQLASHEVGIEEHLANGANFRIINRWMMGRCGIRGDPFQRSGITVVEF